MKDTKPTEAHLERARKQVEDYSGTLMSEWIAAEARRDISARRDRQDPDRVRRRKDADPGYAEVEIHTDPDEIDRYIRENYMRLQAAAIERQVALYARGFVEIEAREIERRRGDDERRTCLICKEVRPDAPIARNLERFESGKTFTSCWACFVTARQVLSEQHMTSVRVNAVRQALRVAS